MFGDSGGENVKADDIEREGQGRHYIDNFLWWGRGFSRKKAILQVSSHARQDSQSP